MNDLLGLATLEDLMPEKITVVGIQPVLLDDYGGSLSKEAKALLPQTIELGRQELESWGIELRQRAEDEEVPMLNSPAVDMDLYEKGRPSEEQASRKGDFRYLFPTARGK